MENAFTAGTGALQEKERYEHRKCSRKEQAVVYATADTLAFSLLSQVSLNLNRQSSLSREESLRQ